MTYTCARALTGEPVHGPCTATLSTAKGMMDSPTIRLIAFGKSHARIRPLPCYWTTSRPRREGPGRKCLRFTTSAHVTYDKKKKFNHHPYIVKIVFKGEF